MDKSSINGRFIEAITYIIDSYSGVNKSILAGEFGITATKFSEILNKRMNVGVDLIAILCSKYDVINIEWLLTGEGNMLKSDQKQNPNTSLPSPKDTTKKHLPIATPGDIGEGIPLIPIEAMAGFNGSDLPGIVPIDCRYYVVPEFEVAGCEFMIRVSGASMQPKYNSGDIIACRPIHEITFFQWGKIYVIDSSQGAMIKRIYQSKESTDHISCVSDNPAYPPFELLKTEIRSLALVIGALTIE